MTFRKYREKGAYHWELTRRNPFSMNAQLRTRYDITLDLLKSSGLSSSNLLVDVGCGDGALMHEVISQTGCSAVGIDTDTTGIELAHYEFSRREASTCFALVGGSTYPFRDGVFSHALCADVIEHVDDPVELLREIHRILRPGGSLVVSTPIRLSEEPLDDHHVNEWFTAEFVELCSRVFDDPNDVILSHPVLSWELYRMNRRFLRPLIRTAMNSFYLLGFNPFLPKRRQNLHSLYGMQTLWLVK